MKAKRMLELELIENEFYFGEVDYLKSIGFNDEDIIYMNMAHYLPYSEIIEELEVYDKSNSKMDELKFINNLCKKYNVEREIIIKRIRQVRKIYNYIFVDNKKKSKNIRIRKKVK